MSKAVDLTKHAKQYEEQSDIQEFDDLEGENEVIDRMAKARSARKPTNLETAQWITIPQIQKIYGVSRLMAEGIVANEDVPIKSMKSGKVSKYKASDIAKFMA